MEKKKNDMKWKKQANKKQKQSLWEKGKERYRNFIEVKKEQREDWCLIK